MAFKMKGNPLKMGSMATKSTMKMAKESAMKMKKESPMEMGHKSPNKMKGKPDKKATNPKRGFEAAGKAAAEGAMTAVAAGKARDLEGQKKLKMTKTVKPANKPKKSAIKLSEEDKKKAMDNAMPAAEKVSMSKATMAGAKKYGFMEGGSFNQDKAKGELRRLSKMTGQTDSNRAKQAEIRKLMKAFS